MAETQTPNYKWIKPDLGGDSAVWGNVINATFDAVDSVVFSNQQGISPIGTIVMFGGATAPANWLFCDGSVYLDTNVPALAAVLKGGGLAGYPGSDATHTAVPNLAGRFPVGMGTGWGQGAMGGEYNHTLLANEMPVHSHAGSQAAHTHPGSYQDVHVHYTWQDAHAHTVGNTQAHSHNIVTGNHSHGIATGGHGHSISTGGHSHSVNVPGSFGYGIGGTFPSPLVNQGSTSWGTTGVGDLGGSASGVGNLGGNTDTAGNLGGYTDTQALAVGNTDTRTPNCYTDNRQPAVHIDTQQPAVSIGNAGGGATANNMPPYTAVGFIIRYK